MKHIQDFIQNSTIADRNNLEGNIKDLEAQLVELREKLAASEDRHQKQLTVSGAISSAIEQIFNVINSCQSIGEPGLTEAFWSEVEDIKKGDYQFIPALKGADSDSDDSNSPNSPDLDSMNLSEIKEYANTLGITPKSVKDDYGSLRKKSSWISAINNHNQNQITTTTIVNDTNKSKDPSDETINNDNVITVESKGVEEKNNEYQVSTHVDLNTNDTPVIATKVDTSLDGSDTLIPTDETNHVEIVSEEDLATQDDEYYDTISESVKSFDAWDNEDIQVKDNQDLDWKVSF
ncbi:MAG: hypothetical protein O4808_21575, partial [Trichodesmium sp. St17_bin3_1_1]|nr:hypothetical protein [Trichodesmium sp. St17_bin3_1_1]